MNTYKIRFNYRFLPYLWFKVPKFVHALTRNSKLHIDGHSDSGRKPVTPK